MEFNLHDNQGKFLDTLKVTKAFPHISINMSY